MLEFIEILPAYGPHDHTATLICDDRRKSRQRVALDSGLQVAFILPRGIFLRDGTRLGATDGSVVLVRAAPEALSQVTASDPVDLARGAYHLGNRHVPLQIGPGWLRYQHDHVLDDMVRTLALKVAELVAPFDPEAGAFSSPGPAGHQHGHGEHQHT